MKIAVIYHTFDGHTKAIADRVAKIHEDAGRVVERFPVTEAPHCLLGYSSVIIGGAIHAGHHDRSLSDYVKARAGDLSAVPSAFFSVSLSASGSDEAERAEASRYVHDFMDQCGWNPDVVGIFGGALQYTRYGWVKRKMMQFIAKRSGRPTDAKLDYDLTDWEAVDHFAQDMIELSNARGEAQPAWD